MMTDASSIREHMEVIGADGVHLGTADKVATGANAMLFEEEEGS